MELGSAWYPEHWPEERWPEDVRLMREAGMTVSRIAEFAWSTMEPRDGVFEFGWLERAIDLLAENGLRAVLGTPTAAPPAWLTQAHPETLAMEPNGRRAQHGNRCHYCVNSPRYHEFCYRIADEMGRRFGTHPNVMGWQIDNEYNRVCYCDVCAARFREFLRERYGSLEELNSRWSTAYWSQTYTDWDQIPMPVGGHNPGLMLEMKRFVTDSYRRFQKLQISALRQYVPADRWITHNFMGWFDGFDHYELARDLDLASWDCYVGTGHHDYLGIGATHDLTRGFKRRGFWLMETQPGSVNWSRINNVLDRGEVRAMAWTAVAHGAEAVLYWQWRSAPGGQEQYHGTVVGQDGEPRPLYEEIQQIGRDFAAASQVLDGSEVKANAAILNSYGDRWSIHWQRHHAEFDYVVHAGAYYRPLASRNIPVDIISSEEELSGYKLVVAPCLLMLSSAEVANLVRYVEGGGHLVLTIRSGMKDEWNALLPSKQPGPLTVLTGARAEEFYALDEPVPVEGEGPLSFHGTSAIWAERLMPIDEGTQVLARFGKCNGWLDGRPAITMRTHGMGRAYYVGAWLDDASQRALMQWVATEAGVAPLMDSPDGVEVARRVRPGGDEVYVVVNHTPNPAVLSLPWSAVDQLTGAAASGSLQLEAYGVAVLVKQ